MGTFPKYTDLPQIHVDEEGPLGHRFENWSSYHNDIDMTCTPYSLRHSFPFTTKLSYATLNTHDMSNMDRFLHGEPGPFTAEYYHGGFGRAREMFQSEHQPLYNPSYESQFPDSLGRYHRQASPMSSGSQSSNNMWSSQHSDDMSSSPRMSLSSPLDNAATTLEIDPSRGMGPGAWPGGAGISLAQIQPWHDEAPTTEYERDTKLNTTHQDLDHMYCQAHSKNEQDSWEDHESVPDVELSHQPSCHEDEEQDSDYKPNGLSGKLCRRRSSQSGSSSPKNGNKRSPRPRKPSTTSVSVLANGNGNKIRKLSKKVVSSEPRHFPCPLADYGCQSTFTSKNEWKRHVSTQHIRLGFWRCDLCPDVANAPNDFNRKDLFTQHLRRMHSCANEKDPLTDSDIADYQTRCYKRVRNPPPKSSCLFCNRNFQGQGSWDERLEHVGRHLEKERKAGKAITDGWNEDVVLRDWFVQEGLVESNGNGGWKLGDGRPRRAELEVLA